MSPGGFSPQSADVCTEGFSSPGLCIMRGGELVQDVVDTLLNMVRSPETVMLDLRSMIACKNVARERMQALAAKYGAKAVGGAGTTLIRQPRALLRERPRELPDGEWQSRRYLDVLVETATVRLSMRKTGDRLVFDFAGSGPQSRHAIGCTRWASLGGLFAPLFPLLCHDITRKAGAIRPVEMIAPEGSIVNCTRPAPVSVATVAAIQPVNNAARATIGRLLAASDRYRDQAAAVWHANQFAILKFGRNRHGGLSIRILTATFAGAGGARAFAGGIDGIPGTRQDVSRGVHPLMGRDSLHVRSNGGGYGDPLDREPGRVAADVATGLLGAAAAAGCIPSTGSTRPGPPSSSSTCRAPSVRPAHRPRCPPPAASSRRPTGSRGRSRRGAPR
jgi:N-methylhydantoinase B